MKTLKTYNQLLNENYFTDIAEKTDVDWVFKQ